MLRPIHGGNLDWAGQVANCPASSILDFSASINPLGPPISALNAIHQGINLLTAYPDPQYRYLRSALSKKWGLSPTYFLPGNGSAALMNWTARELSRQCRVTHLFTPAFNDYYRALNAFSVSLKTHRLNFEIETDFLELAINDESPFEGLLLNNPHNPSGKLFRRADIVTCLKRLALVVIDEAFMDFLPLKLEESLISLVADYSNLIILRSLTKFYSLPGLRLGYAIANPEILARWQQWQDPWSVNTLAALATEAVLEDDTFPQRTWDWLPGAREQLWQGLAKLPGLSPMKSCVNFILVKTQIPSPQIQAQLLKNYRILIRDCLSFPELGEDFFRVAVRTQAQNQTLLEGLAAVLG